MRVTVDLPDGVDGTLDLEGRPPIHLSSGEHVLVLQ
jgi:hypothetical protein